jgi:serine/threonine-protein kinase
VARRARLHDEAAWALTQLAAAVSWLAWLRRDPAAALAPPDTSPALDPALMAAAEQAVSTGAPTGAQAAAIWAERVGPLLRPAVTAAVAAAVDLRRAAVTAAAADDRIGPYRKLRRLGSGGHGEVWLVRREGNRRFVLKMPLRARELDEDARAAYNAVLEREAAMLESLHEAKVASFIDYGWDGHVPYLVLEYLVGVDLQRYCHTRPLTVAELKPIVRDVCIGLRALHGRNIVHRDMKPSNVFLRLQLPPGGGEDFVALLRDPAVAPVAEAVLIDFGVARLMRDRPGTDAPEGTLGYLSPEQAQASDDVGTASDVYALAATIYTAMTNQRFFADRPNKTACLVAHAFERPLEDKEIKKHAKALPRGLRALLDEATSLDPEERPDIARFAARFESL